MPNEIESDIPLDVLVVGSGREDYGPPLAQRSLTVERRSNLFSALALLASRPVRVLAIGYEEIADREGAAVAEIRRVAREARILLLHPPSFADRMHDAPPDGVSDAIEEPCLPETVARRIELLLGLPASPLGFERFVLQATKAGQNTSLLARILVDYAQSVARAGRVSLLFYRKSRGVFRIAEARGLPPDVDRETKASRTVASWLARTPRPVLVDDVSTSEFLPLAHPERYESPSFLSFPLVANGRLMGLLCLSEPGPGRVFTEREQRALLVAVDVTASLLHSARQIRHLRQMSILDPLTGLCNRRLFDRLLEMEVGRSRRSKEPVSLILLDLDDFKEYQDEHGHPAGDDRLRQTADVLNHVFRGTDICCRFGGDEFGVVMPGTSLEAAQTVLDRFTMRLAELDTTISAGVSIAPDDGLSADTLTRAADRRLYEAKRKYKVERAAGAAFEATEGGAGALVSSVEPDGAADRAGLAAGDVVVATEAVEIGSPTELYAEVYSILKQGDHEFAIRVARGEQELALELPLRYIR